MSRGRAFRCQECAAPHPKWVGRCPSCLAWNSLVEAPPVRSRRRRGPGGPARRAARSRSGEVPAVEGAAVPTGLAELDRVLSGGLVRGLGHPPRRRAGHRQVHPAAPGGGGHGRRGAPARSTSPPRSRRRRSGRAPIASERSADGLWVVATADVDGVVEQLGGGRWDLLVVDSVQAVPRAGPDVPAGLGRPGARLRPPPGRGGTGHRRGDDPRRPRHQGRLTGRAPPARAPRRHGPRLRGRPPPRAAPAPGRQAPLRADERARAVRDDRGRAGRGARCRRALPRRPATRGAGFGRAARDGGPPPAAGRGAGPGEPHARRLAAALGGGSRRWAGRPPAGGAGEAAGGPSGERRRLHPGRRRCPHQRARRGPGAGPRGRQLGVRRRARSRGRRLRRGGAGRRGPAGPAPSPPPGRGGPARVPHGHRAGVGVRRCPGPRRPRRAQRR